MKYTFNNDDVVVSRPFEGPLAEHIAGFAEWARKQGYARYSRYRQVLLAACFSRWLGQQAVSVPRVSSEHAARYLQSRARHVQIQRGDAAALAFCWPATPSGHALRREDPVTPVDPRRASRQYRIGRSWCCSTICFFIRACPTVQSRFAGVSIGVIKMQPSRRCARKMATSPAAESTLRRPCNRLNSGQPCL